MRRWAVLLAIAFAVGCGSRGATAPTPASDGPLINVTSGTYRLLLNMSTTGDPVCDGLACSSVSLCAQVAGAPLISVFTPTTAMIERTGDALVVRPADSAATFRMDLLLRDGTVSGTASGRFSTGGITVQVGNGTPGGPAVVTGTLQRNSLAGTLQGSIEVGGSGCSNNGHTWSLTPP